MNQPDPQLLVSFLFLVHVPLCALAQQPISNGSEAGIAVTAKLVQRLSGEGIQVEQRDNTLRFTLDSSVLARKQFTIARLCAPIRSIRWQQHPEEKIDIVPEPDRWVFSWKSTPGDEQESPAVIEVFFDTAPILLEDCASAVQTGDGSIMLHAYQVHTFGDKLRFEPQWYKNTVGYWTISTDYASWELLVDQPGTFAVAVLQGCGEGQGGSNALLTLQHAERVVAELPFQTIDTGHFQNFRWNHLGMLQIEEPGEYRLRIEARKIAKAALCDLRAIHLVRQAKPLR